MKNLNYLFVGASVLVLTACGSQSTSSSLGSSSAAATTTTTTSTASSTGNVNNLPSAYQTLVQVTGNGGTAPTYTINSLTTSRTLKVKISPQSAPQVSGTSWVFPYGCISVQVTVDGSTQQSASIPVSSSGTDSNCTGGAFSVLDFSNVMTGDNLGNGRVSVELHDVDYDNCRSY